MIFYSEKNVYEAAKDRIRDAFRQNTGKKFCVTFSGGKDSSTVLHLVHEVMGEFGIKRIPVLFLDQEVEAPQTIEYTRKVMNYDWVEPYWIQCFFQEWNASKGDWFNVWGPGEKWVRDKESSGTITDIIYPKHQYFSETLDSCMEYHFGKDLVTFNGMRIEESPKRRRLLSRNGGTPVWSKNDKRLTLCPIWDWSANDVWYYIFSNRFEYCKLYNYMLTKRPIGKCRVSSFIHESSIFTLKDLKEYAPAFYEKALKRVDNINSSVQSLDMLSMFAQTLPPYFKDWEDYVNYLIDNIVELDTNKKKFRNGYYSYLRRWRKKCAAPEYQSFLVNQEKEIGRQFVQSIIYEDFPLSGVVNCDYGWVVNFLQYKDGLKRANKESV